MPDESESRGNDDLAPAIEALKLAVGTYPDLDAILAGNPPAMQLAILKIFLKVATNSARMELCNRHPTVN